MVVVDIVWCFLIYEQIQNQQLIGKMSKINNISYFTSF